MELWGEVEGEVVATMIIHHLRCSRSSRRKDINRIAAAGRNIAICKRHQGEGADLQSDHTEPEPHDRQRWAHQQHARTDRHLRAAGAGGK